MASSRSGQVQGQVSSGFEAVRDAFVENFARRRELGGACCAFHHGKRVVDLWGGIRNVETGEPWERDTMVIVYSATKGLAAMTLALAHSRGWLDYEERVCTYWPEFAQNGKERITVRQLLAHQAGLFAFDEPVDRGTVADLDRLAAVMARQRPAWEPGTRLAYHALTIGFYEGELLRRVDPRHRSLGQFFQEEIAAPLGLDVYIRLPEEMPSSRLATIVQPRPRGARRRAAAALPARHAPSAHPGARRLLRVEICLPEAFPDKYRQAIVRAVEQCTVKRHILHPPIFEVRVAEPAAPVPSAAAAIAGAGARLLREHRARLALLLLMVGVVGTVAATEPLHRIAISIVDSTGRLVTDHPLAGAISLRALVDDPDVYAREAEMAGERETNRAGPHHQDLARIPRYVHPSSPLA